MATPTNKIVPHIEVSPISKRFHVDSIDDAENELRKSILRQIGDFKFARIISNFSSNVYSYKNYKIPVEFNVEKRQSILLRMDPNSYLCGKVDYEILFILLHNELCLRHRKKGLTTKTLISGDRLRVPPNKRFFLSCDDVDMTHLLMLLPSDIVRFPDFFASHFVK